MPVMRSPAIPRLSLAPAKLLQLKAVMGRTIQKVGVDECRIHPKRQWMMLMVIVMLMPPAAAAAAAAAEEEEEDGLAKASLQHLSMYI